MRIEDYAVIGDTQSLALVGRNGSIDWLCLPRFDSGACFAALLGKPEHGRFALQPKGEFTTKRRYRKDSLVLETEVTTKSGVVRIVDTMPIRGKYPDVVRVVEGVSGSVEMHAEIVIRFDYGSIVPWVRRIDGRLSAVAGPDALVLATPVETRGEGYTTVADFTVRQGDRVPFVLTWYPSHERVPENAEPFTAVDDSDRFWREWAARYRDDGPYRDAIVRSLLTLKALTYRPTGGIVAAGTTSLPESLGGERNWDYRYCWVRDATLTLYSLMHAGYTEEAKAWLDWLHRAVAGDPARMQIMYGPAGERRLDERTVPWLPGYEGSQPVRIGNAAAGQIQLDVAGEVIDAFHQARRMNLGDRSMWAMECVIGNWLVDAWRKPDLGIWEMRSEPQHFVHSKVMTWCAFDRLVKAVEQHGLPGPVDKWRRTRDEIHENVCRRGFDPDLGSFVQAYGSKMLDASLLMIPAVGFLPPEDERVAGTVAAIEKHLVEDGFVKRYETLPGRGVDGLHGREGAFLACSFWLVDALALLGRRDDAKRMFDRLLGVRNDVGLLSEEYDVRAERLVGNFPQAFSHVALVNSARTLSRETEGAAEHRRRS